MIFPGSSVISSPNITQSSTAMLLKKIDELELENTQLSKENSELKAKNAELKAENSHLSQTNEKLIATNKSLDAFRNIK